MPARQSFVLEMVGPERLTNAVSLNTITMNMGRLVGPGHRRYWSSPTGTSAVCFFANGISFVAAVIALAVMRTDELQTAPPVRGPKGQLREGLRYVWATPALGAPFLLMLAIGMLTYEFQVTLPVLARDTYGVGADGFGLLQSAMSIGAIVGGLLFATRTNPTHRRLGLAAGGSASSCWCWPLRPASGPPSWCCPSSVPAASCSSPWPTPRCNWPPPGDAQPGDGALHRGLHRLHPHRRTDRRVPWPRCSAPAGRWSSAARWPSWRPTVAWRFLRQPAELAP